MYIFFSYYKGIMLFFKNEKVNANKVFTVTQLKVWVCIRNKYLNMNFSIIIDTLI